ncbi:protein kinase [Actinomadura sp. J1-007]|nr:protein kinase [Actinomadura sp. J1-007]
MSPEMIGRYRLEEELGAGAFAVVWLARDDALETAVAIKVMAGHWARRADVRERFLAEARLLRQASSPQVAQVFDIGELPDGRPYFVMEHADRGTLADRLAEGTLPVAEAVRLTAEVARGAADLHEAGILHRDLKPSNVLVRSVPGGRERLLIADLGLAKSLAHASGLTMGAGSAGYMPPEQMGPTAGLDERADVYSLGAIGYHLLTGTVPGPPGQIVAPRALRPEIPARVEQVLLRAMRPERDDRWPSARAFAAELGRPGRSVPGVRRRWRWLAVPAAVAVLAGGGYYALTTPWHGSGTVSVQDGSGRIHLKVPDPWGGQLADSGWDPSTVGGKGGRQPGLLVAASVADWPDLRAEDEGVFAGLSPQDLGRRVDGITHPGCRDGGRHTVRAGRWQGVDRRFDCPGTGTVEEITLSAPGASAHAYVQVRQSAGSDETRRVLSDLRISA